MCVPLCYLFNRQLLCSSLLPKSTFIYKSTRRERQHSRKNAQFVYSRVRKPEMYYHRNLIISYCIICGSHSTFEHLRRFVFSVFLPSLRPRHPTSNNSRLIPGSTSSSSSPVLAVYFPGTTMPTRRPSRPQEPEQPSGRHVQYSAPVALVSLHILNPLFPYVCPTMLPVQPSTSVFVFISKIDIYI